MRFGCISYDCGICRNTAFKGIHNFIHLNLALALLLGLILFVSGNEIATESDVSLYNYVQCLSLL